MTGMEIFKTVLWIVPLYLATVLVSRIIIEIICYFVESLIEKIEDYRFVKRLNKKKTPEETLIITKEMQKQLFEAIRM